MTKTSGSSCPSRTVGTKKRAMVIRTGNIQGVETRDRLAGVDSLGACSGSSVYCNEPLRKGMVAADLVSLKKLTYN